ncbi:M23/M56 family metallopeptidase [Hirschia litorea]|uniref:M23/M56 family metallopeptidase n=1 Tax=Hirschia litorea TaxID=1199156 RepID=A0ABW2IJU7_9PROT
MNFVMLLVLSIVWGGIVVVAAAGVQRLGLSGRTRQMMWRCAGGMLLAPFPVAMVYALAEPGKIAPIWNYGEGEAPSIPIVLDQVPAMNTTPIAQTVTQASPFQFDFMMALTAFLVLGWLFRAFRARWASRELKQITSKAVPIRSYTVLNAAEFWQSRLGLARKASFQLMPGDYSPFTQGVFKPVVYLPHGLERELGAEELALVVGHELMHVRRLDALWRPAERIVADILWFNPFAWMVRAELDRAREIACDEAMLVSKAPPTVYARALVAAARFAEGLPTRAPAAAMFPFNKDKELTERVKIAVANTQGSSSFVGLAAFGAFLLAGLPLAAAQGAGAEKVRSPLPQFEETVVKSEKARITSGFGKRKHPISKEVKDHAGIDIADKKGTKIYAPANGVITFAGFKDGYGNVVQVDYNPEWMGRFGQLDKILVEAGQSVQAGDVIGLLGESGNATGPHLHLEVFGPAPDYVQSGRKIAYDPERLGVALIPALEDRARQIRELGVVLPSQIQQPQKVSDVIAPIAPPAPLAPEPPKAPQPPKVTGITYLQDGRVQVLDGGVVFMEFAPQKGDLIPRLVGKHNDSSKRRRYNYKEVNGDKVELQAGTQDIPSSKLGIWVNRQKIESLADWQEWRADVDEHITDHFEISIDHDFEHLEHDLEMQIEEALRESENGVELAGINTEKWEAALEAKAEARAEAIAQSFEKNWSSNAEGWEKQAAAMGRKASERARVFAEAQAMSSHTFAQDWTSEGQHRAAAIHVAALEEALHDLDDELISLDEQCDAAEGKKGAGSKYELQGLKMAKKSVEQARAQVASQLHEARVSLSK